jgi:O-methyltransferase involved in polyketide biosynthesis
VTNRSSTPGQQPSPKIDTNVAHSARIWNYWLGGKDHYPVDRRVGDQILEMFPHIAYLARADRAFLGRAVSYLISEAGIRQFLDIGTGLPTADNTHEVAQRIAPECRIVYVDNDPLVLAHARALLTGTPPGATDYLDADLRDPEKIVQEAARTLDFSQPVAVMLLGILHHISDDGEAYTIVDRLLDAVPPGSYLTIAHSTNEITGAAMDEAVQHWNQFGKPPMTLRTPQAIARFFDRMELLEPGVVSTSRWRPDPADTSSGPVPETDEFCAVGRKR